MKNYDRTNPHFTAAYEAVGEAWSALEECRNDNVKLAAIRGKLLRARADVNRAVRDIDAVLRQRRARAAAAEARGVLR